MDYVDALFGSERTLVVLTADVERTLRTLDTAMDEGLATAYIQLGEHCVLSSMGMRFEGASFVITTPGRQKLRLARYLLEHGDGDVSFVAEWVHSGAIRRVWPEVSRRHGPPPAHASGSADAEDET